MDQIQEYANLFLELDAQLPDDDKREQLQAMLLWLVPQFDDPDGTSGDLVKYAKVGRIRLTQLLRAAGFCPPEEPDIRNPRHTMYHEHPCDWCGAEWTKAKPPEEGMIMKHWANCDYVFYTEHNDG